MVMKRFRLEDSIGFQVNATAVRLKNELHRAFKSHGYHVTPEHWAVLNCLWEEEGQTQSEIAERIVKDKTNLTRILDVMEKNGLIERHPHEKDRRSYRIFPTEKGRDLKTRLIPIAIQLNQIVTKGFSEKEREVVVRLMKRISKNLE